MKNFFLSNMHFLIGAVLTLSLLWPLFAAPYFTHHDDVQIIRLYEMDKCIKDGQVPCRWVPDLGGLYGYPLFNYYAPLPYYFGELVYLLTNSLLFSVKTMFALSFLGAYVFMYLFASKLWGKLGGSISAVFYSFAPYHALDFYVRGAMGEMWALMLFPAVCWAIVKLEEKTNVANLLLFGISFAALVTSHNLSAMIFLPVIVLWIILLFFKKRNCCFLWFCFFSVLTGLMLSAFYLLPMLAEKNLVHVDTTTSGYFSYTEHFKGFRKLLLDRFWGWGASVREVPGGEKEGMSYQIGWAHLLGWLLAIVAVKAFWKEKRWVSWVIIFSSLAALLSVFMIHPRSEFIWKVITPLKYMQFPWRFLLPVVFFTSLLSGSFFLMHFKRQNLWWALLVSMAVALNFLYFRPEKFIRTSDEQLLSGSAWDKQIKRSIFDYLPIYAKEPPPELASARYRILAGTAQVADFKEGTNWFNFTITTDGHTIIRLSQYYFPDWKILVNGREANVEYKNNSLGLMTLILGEGTYRIDGRLHDTPIRSVGNLITLTGFAAGAALFLVSFSRVRKWLAYYRKRIN